MYRAIYFFGWQVKNMEDGRCSERTWMTEQTANRIATYLNVRALRQRKLDLLSEYVDSRDPETWETIQNIGRTLNEMTAADRRRRGPRTITIQVAAATREP